MGLIRVSHYSGHAARRTELPRLWQRICMIGNTAAMRVRRTRTVMLYNWFGEDRVSDMLFVALLMLVTLLPLC